MNQFQNDIDITSSVFINTDYKGFNQLLLTAQFRSGINSLVNGNQDIIF